MPDGKTYDVITNTIIDMEDLIEALRIFSKYTDSKYPTKCEHEELYVNCVKPKDVTPEDLAELEKLGFVPFQDFAFVSFRFGDN